MSVVMIIAGSLVTALLVIGIVGGVILNSIAVVRLIAGKGRFQTGWANGSCFPVSAC